MKKIAILIEDDPDDSEQISDVLKSQGFLVIPANDSGDALKCIESCPIPDLIVLDWFMEGSDAGDLPAQNFLKSIMKSSFAPIAIVTSDIVRARENIPNEIPQWFCMFFPKDDIKSAIQSTLAGIATRQEFKISHLVLDPVVGAIAQAYWHLVKYEENGVNGWLAAVEDYNDFLDMFLRFLRRALDAVPSYGKDLDAKIAQAKTVNSSVTPLLRRALSMDRYLIPPSHSPPMSGDIYKHPENTYSILINPSCDLVSGEMRVKKAERASLIEAKDLLDVEQDSTNGQSRKNRIKNRLKNRDASGNGSMRTYTLPLVPSGDADPYSRYVHLIAFFERQETLSWDDFEKTYGVSKRIARVDSPFMEVFLRQYSMFANRIGVREVPEAVINEIAENKLGS